MKNSSKVWQCKEKSYNHSKTSLFVETKEHFDEDAAYFKMAQSDLTV